MLPWRRMQHERQVPEIPRSPRGGYQSRATAGWRVQCALENGHWEGESAILRKDGRDLPVCQTILARGDASDAQHMMSTLIHDISARKLADNLRNA